MSALGAWLLDIGYRFRFLTAALVAGGALVFLPTLDLTRVDNDLSVWISKDDPVYVNYERFRHEFGGTRSLIVALESDRLFTPEGLGYIDRISRELTQVRLVDRVYSLATANVVRVLPAAEDEEAGIEVRPLLEWGFDTPEGISRIKEDALSDPLLRHDLISQDGRVAAVVVTFDEDRIDDVRGQALDEARAIVERDKPEGIVTHYNGPLEISETYNRVTVANTTSLTFPILAIVALSLYWMFRSVAATATILVAVGLSVLWALGLYEALGFEFNILTSMLAPLIVVLAIADDVHVVQHFDFERRRTGSTQQAYTLTLKHLFLPLFGASITTALGLLALATSDIVAVRTFGIAAAVGVMVDFVLSLTFLPALLTVVKMKAAPPPQEQWLMSPLQRVSRFAFTHSGAVLAAMLVMVVLAGVGIRSLRVDTNHVNFFAPTHPLARSAAVVDQKLSGIYSFNVLLEGPEESLTDTDTLARVERLSEQLTQLPFVRKVSSVTDYVKRVNQQLAGGSADAYRLPDTREAVAQELFVFGLSEEGRQDLSRMVSSDYSRAHIAVKLASMSSDRVFEQINTADLLAAQAFAGSPVRPTVTGSGRIFSTLDHNLVVSQLSSFGTAFVTVFAVVFILFKSARFGVLGIIVNTFPVVVVLGVMGWLDISLNVATVMVASVALGIVDDDTIHFISRYRHETAAGLSSADAIEVASMHEGRAALTTTVVNSASFIVLMTSDYRPTAWFGSLLAVTMLLAFLAEVLMVPAIIAMFPRIFGTRTAHRPVGVEA